MGRRFTIEPIEDVVFAGLVQILRKDELIHLR